MPPSSPGTAQTVKLQTLQIAGEKRYASSIHAHIAIGDAGWPFVEVTSHERTEAYTSSIKLTPRQIARTLSSRQNKIFEDRNSPDFRLNASVSPGNSITYGDFSFRGFTCGPSVSISVNNVTFGDRAVPEYAKIDRLSYACYSPRPSVVLAEGKPVLREKKKLVPFIQGCAEELVKSYEELELDDEPAIQASVMARQDQHKANQDIQHYFFELLKESDENLGWEDAINALAKDEFSGDTKLRERVMSCLMMKSGSFRSTIDALAALFQCVYVPGWEEIGRLVPLKELLSERGAKTMKIAITNISGFVGPANSLYPISYVAVTPNNAKPGILLAEAVHPFFVAPEDNVGRGGTQIQDPGPQWIDADVCDLENAKDGASKRKANASTKKAKEGPKKKKDKEKDLAKTLADIYITWADNLYRYNVLAESQISITTPILFDSEIGQRYNVVDVNGGGRLFSGILVSIDHYIVAGTSPQAYTTLKFGWVIMTGASIPGI